MLIKFINFCANLKKSLIFQKVANYLLFYFNYYSKVVVPHEKDYLGIKKINYKKKNLQSDCIIDIGANNGLSALFFLKNFKHSKVISFEPNTGNNFFLNKVKKKFLNFNFHNLALGSSKKKSTLYLPIINSIENTSLASFDLDYLKKKLIEDFGLEKSKKFIIKKKNYLINTLDNYKYNPFFIKLDCEGYEYEILKGARKTLKKNLPLLLIEYDEIKFKKIYKLLINDYSFYIFDQRQIIKVKNFNKIKKNSLSQINIFCKPN